MTEPRRFPLGLTIATAISMAILIGLGVRQVQRLAWKEDLLARIAALQAAPARDLGPVLTQLKNGADVEFTRVRLTGCKGIAAAPYLELYGVRNGQAGSRLISACRLQHAPYGAVLVDRGFVADTVSARPPVDPGSTAALDIVAVLRKPDPASFVSPPNDPAANRWYTRDVAAMAKALKVADPAPLFLMAETRTNPEWAALDPAPLPAEIPNRHLEYALTWFGLAGALASVYAAVLIRRRKN
jgi:surfeit locus 1 family protein